MTGFSDSMNVNSMGFQGWSQLLGRSSMDQSNVMEFGPYIDELTPNSPQGEGIKGFNPLGLARITNIIMGKFSENATQRDISSMEGIENTLRETATAYEENNLGSKLSGRAFLGKSFLTSCINFGEAVYNKYTYGHFLSTPATLRLSADSLSGKVKYLKSLLNKEVSSWLSDSTVSTEEASV